MLLHADVFMGMVKQFRVVHFTGRFGGGKTSLAFRVAAELLESGYCRHLVTNVKSVWADDVFDVKMPGTTLDTVIILDEGGLFLENSVQVRQFIAFARKLNVVLLIPSVTPPTARVRFLSVQRVVNCEVLGLPLWVYQYRLVMGRVVEKDWFAWYRPSEIFGVYDTEGFPSDDAGLGDWIVKKTLEAKQKAGYGQTPQEVVFEAGGGIGVSGLARDGGDVAIAVQDAAEQISETVSILETFKQRGSRRH